MGAWGGWLGRSPQPRPPGACGFTAASTEEAIDLHHHQAGTAG
jgi:hypothetical protein